MSRDEYVIHICKNCKRAFLAEDTSNCSDTPCNSKYCIDCVKKGFRNKVTNREERFIVKLYDFIQEKGIKDENIISAMETIYINTIKNNKKIQLSTVYNKARRTVNEK